jgi:excinuclease ABC subunit A
MPWRVLGRKWHVLRKGFSSPVQVRWNVEVLEKLFRLLEKTAPKGQFVWSNKVLVPVYVPVQKEPWATVLTKKPDAVHLVLTGPKGIFALGQITRLGHEPQLDGERPECDLIRLKFRSARDLARGDLPGFLKEHLATLNHGE